jgi:streptomycin 6-kinase
MTPSSFTNWRAAMKAAGLAKSDADCARLLGITPRGFSTLKQKGTDDRRTALACAALLRKIKPYA